MSAASTLRTTGFSSHQLRKGVSADSNAVIRSVYFMSLGTGHALILGTDDDGDKWTRFCNDHLFFGLPIVRDFGE